MTRMPPVIDEHVALSGQGTLRSASGDAGAGLAPGDLIRILRQRIFLVLFIWMFVVAAAVGGTYLWIRYWPGFEAVGYVHVISLNPQPVLEQAANPMHGDLMQRALEDQAVLLKDLGVLTRTLQDAEVQTTSWYRSFQGDTQQAFLDLRDELVCVPMKGSSYVRVGFTCLDQQDPHVIINALLQRYRTEAQRRAELRYVDERAAIGRELEDLLRQIRSQESAIRSFVQREMPAGGALETENATTARLRMLTEQLAQAEEESRQFWEYWRVYDDPALDQAPLHLHQQIEQDPSVAMANAQLQNFDYQLDVYTSNGLGAEHRFIRMLTTQREATAGRLEDLRASLEGKYLAFQRYLARVQWEVAWNRVLKLRDQVAEAEAQQRDLDIKRVQYEAMKRELDRLQKTYDARMEDSRSLDLAMQSGHTFRVDPVWAGEPKERAVPRWEINVPVGIVLGLLLGAGFAILLEFLDTSMRTGRDVVRHVNIPILGTVPDLDDEELAIDDIMSAVTKAPNSMVAEAFRAIRTNLQLSAPADRQRTLVVTSPQPEDGKTAVAVNLAEAIAHNHRRTLLIDANFRRPALHGVYRQPSDHGLSDLLIGQGPLESLVRPSGIERLDVLCCGRIPPNPAELLGGPEMQSLIEEAARRYDQIIFDAPPVLLVTDALVIGSIVDAVILVCRAKTNSRGVVRRARDCLLDVNAQIIGAVLNAAQVRRGGYFREQYRAFYDYQSESMPAIEPPRDAK